MRYDIEKEKREAIEAGRRALNSLRTAKENLNSAKNWGLVDMFGGGFFTTMLKHSKMDQAKRNMEQAKYDLRNFSSELNDVNMVDRKSTRLNSSHSGQSRMPSSA